MSNFPNTNNLVVFTGLVWLASSKLPPPCNGNGGEDTTCSATVLCYVKADGGKWVTGHYDHELNLWWWHGDETDPKNAEVTHWSPLPPTPHENE